jgi:hypothetical protein
MKKVLLLSCAVAFTLSANSQGRLATPQLSGKPVFTEKKISSPDENAVVTNKSPYVARNANRSGGGGNNSVQNVITLGTAANALTAVGIRNYVWADPTIGNGTTNGTVVFTHRAVGGTTGIINGGRIMYDISMDNGANWDTTQGPVYTPSLSTVINPSNARYPQGAVYNPAATNLANDAYLNYYTATLNNTNASGATNWGGNAYGSYKLDSSANPTQHEEVSDSINGVWYVIPELLHMTKNGKTFALSESDYGNSDVVLGRGVAYDYNGTMIWQNGTWNSTTNEFDYTRQLLSVPSGELPYNRWYSHPYGGGSTNNLPVSTMLGSAIAFNDSGNIGYMVNKMFLNTADSPDTSAYLYVYKTTDGGTTWGMLDSIPNFDESTWLMDSSGYGMTLSGQYFDVMVDGNDNLHMIIVVGTKYMSELYGTSSYYYEGFGSILDIFTSDGGLTWWAHKLKTDQIHEVYGVMGDPAVAANRQVYDNRPQITRSYDGTKLFFSWFETDTNVATNGWAPDPLNLGYNNQHPDMHVVGYDVTTSMWTPEMNMTKFPALNGDADGSAWLGSVSYYALDNGAGGHKIPTVIGTPLATSTNNNPDWQSPFTFKYLDGVEVPAGSYTVAEVQPGGAGTVNHVMLRAVQPVGTHNIKLNNDFIVTPVTPNPFSGNAEILVQISKPGTVLVEVRNVLGQVVSTEAYSKSGGAHKITIDGSKLEAGLYLCTVTYNNQQITQKMNVK